MKLIVLSNPTMLDREIELIHLLFEAGLERFHLRKPDWTMGAYKSFLHHIDPKYHAKISIHAHHELLETFELGGLHFTEKHREDQSVNELIALRKKGIVLSTSFHQLTQLTQWDGLFNYAFLSPVFDSISKQGYSGVFQAGLQQTDFKTQVIALGGIQAGNIGQIQEMQFSGAAVLGAIWKTPHLAVKNFTTLKQLTQCAPMF
ncbi:MAG: thiamine phosphate synthase [Flammeovirgaceae bacterium]